MTKCMMNKLLVNSYKATSQCSRVTNRNIITCSSQCASKKSDVERRDENDIRNIVPSISSSKSFPSIETLELKRGTGGRSSFSGIVATVFGPGDIGRAVINGLARVGSQVIVPYRSDPSKIRGIKLMGDLGQILFVPFHLRDDVSIRKAMKYSTVVVNAIGNHRDTPNFTLDELHVDGCARIARLARESGVKRLIHLSALNCSPNPPAKYIKGGSKFLRSKWAGEQAVRNEFPEATIIRPAETFGSDPNWAVYWAYFWRRHFEGHYLTNRGLGTYKLPVFQDDVADGIVSAINDSTTIGRVIEAYGPAKHQMHDMVNWMRNILQMDEIHGFSPIGDIRRRPGIFLRMRVLQNFTYIPVSMERLELETITDMPDPSNLNLYHLGIEPSKLEDKGPIVLRPYRKFAKYDSDLPKPPPIPVYPTFYPNTEE